MFIGVLIAANGFKQISLNKTINTAPRTAIGES